MTPTFATVSPANATFALHPTEADATAAADAQDHLLVLIPDDLHELTIKEGAALFAATAAALGIAPVKRFPDRETAARRIWANLVALSAAAPVPETAPEPAPQPSVQPKAKAQPKARKTPRGIQLAPKAEARACRAGTKQAILVDMLFRSGGASMAGMDHSQMGQDGMAGMDMGAMGQGDMMAMPGMDGMAMDLNDYNFDAYLANDRTLDDPEVVQVDKGSKVLVRVINAAAATVFWIDTGALTGRLVAVDGEPVQPLPGNRFGIAMGQRLDIELNVPAEGGAFPVLALREGARERTGLVLATPGATVTKVANMSDADHPAFSADLTQEAALRAVTPLPERAASSQPMLMLGGSMMPYVWTINGQTWGKHSPVTAKTGERVEIMFHNMSMMAHPMHLHGHAFQVVGVGQNRIAGAVRDTVHVPPMGMVTVAVDAGEAARWMLHCHHMPHLSTGMMTEFAVSA